MTPAEAYPRPGITERVSIASDGAQGNGGSAVPAISADGRYVAFHSGAPNLGATNTTWNVFVHDRQTGVTELVSVASDGTAGNGQSLFPAISADGRHVAFDSVASNLVPGDTNATWDVFVHDRGTGVTERVSVASDGTQGNDQSLYPTISADGRYVAFHSYSSSFVPDDTNATWDVFVHDRETGVTERVSVASDGAEANAQSVMSAISADGRHVAFHSLASNLVPGDTNATWDVFVHDRQTGVTERVSVASEGAEGNGASFYSAISHPAISADGRHVAFDSLAANLVAGDTNATWDVFVHDRQTGATERVSAASDDAEGNGASAVPAISADGRYVAFHSEAANLVAGDTNNTWDIFVRDRGLAAGVGNLAATKAGAELTVSGWATFSGATIASVDDPTSGGVGPLGAEIAGASVISRPEQEDLLLRLRLASLPGPAVGGAPGILYRWSFTAGETAYEVRALRAAATVVPPTAAPYFALYECAPACEETARLTGGVGTTGPEVRLSVPLEALGLEDGAALTALEASTALGEASTGALVVLDDVQLPEATIPGAQVMLGIAPAGTPEDEVAFDTEAALTDGLFSGTVDTSALPGGDYEAWARACLGDTCGTRSVDVSL